MKEVDNIVKDISASFSNNNYPDAFLAAYDQIECLGSHRGCETFVVQEKSTEHQFIAKCFDRRIYPSANGLGLLKQLDHAGLPRYVCELQNKDYLCVIREYVEGTPLNVYCKENDLDSETIRKICLNLCDILIYLHTLPEPVIHRDIKPSNIVLSADGNITLIDFDIARTYREDARTDTIFLGTKGYAAPEQYGFTQTDPRSDIYSFGILMRQLLTGSIRENCNIAIKDAQLKRIIERCTAFSPQERYDSMKDVKAALLESAPKKRIRPRNLVACIATGLAALLLGFCLGRYADLNYAGGQPANPIAFKEPLIEEAVRMQLGVGPEYMLREDDLLKVSAIYINGRKAYQTYDEYQNDMTRNHEPGFISTLDDFLLIPNLARAMISRQGTIDISALTSCENLQSFELKHLQVNDFSPISSLVNLRFIALWDTNFSDMRLLDPCLKLREIDAGKSDIITFTNLSSNPRISRLYLNELYIEDLEGIENYVNLELITLKDANVEDYSALLKLNDLKTIYADKSNGQVLSELFEGSSVEIIVTE